MRVLIVDDRPCRLEALERVLRDQQDVRLVGVARDGVEAFGVLRECRPDAILMGTAMAGVDGLTTLRLLRRWVTIPVVVLAEPPEVESVLDALTLGAVGFVSLEESECSDRAMLCQRLGALCRRTMPIRETVLRTAPGAAPRVRLVGVPGGALAGLGDRLRAEPGPIDSALHIVLDAPRWLVSPFARRLHRATPWRVLDAAPGDRLAPGHALVSSLADGLRVVAENGRARLERGAPWRDVDDVVGAVSPSGSRATRGVVARRPAEMP